MTINRRYPSSMDVARLAGVSQSAVSRAYSEGKSVSPETRRKIFEAAGELGYSPSFIPRILLKHRSNLVAMVISGTSNPFYALAIEEFTTALQDAGYQVLLIHAATDHSLDSVVDKLASYRVDAIVSALPVLSQDAARALARRKIPTISFNTAINTPWISSVSTDNLGGAIAIAELFVARGAKSFAFVAGSAGSHASHERLRGFKTGLRRKGFRFVEVVPGDFLYQGGHDAVMTLQAAGKLPEAIFCANDLMAIGALDALRKDLGLKVPGDVLVAGFDNVPEASWAAYDLTSVVQDSKAMVHAAMSILHRMISTETRADGILRVVPGPLIERSTTRR
jgi:DNA-binding LacI/PurR family transcriptional regulator